jgi:hypothetical protein
MSRKARGAGRCGARGGSAGGGGAGGVGVGGGGRETVKPVFNKPRRVYFHKLPSQQRITVEWNKNVQAPHQSI